MSLQVCHCCGWSKVTSYQGLRVHQGKNRCTPKGMRIAEPQHQDMWGFTGQTTASMSYKLDVSTAIKSDASLQICHCGWTQVTSYHGLRVHQGMKGCTPKGARIPKEEQKAWGDYWKPQVDDQKPPDLKKLNKKHEYFPEKPRMTKLSNPAAAATVKTENNSRTRHATRSTPWHQLEEWSTPLKISEDSLNTGSCYNYATAAPAVKEEPKSPPAVSLRRYPDDCNGTSVREFEDYSPYLQINHRLEENPAVVFDKPALHQKQQCRSVMDHPATPPVDPHEEESLLSASEQETAKSQLLKEIQTCLEKFKIKREGKLGNISPSDSACEINKSVSKHPKAGPPVQPERKDFILLDRTSEKAERSPATDGAIFASKKDSKEEAQNAGASTRVSSPPANKSPFTTPPHPFKKPTDRKVAAAEQDTNLKSFQLSSQGCERPLAPPVVPPKRNSRSFTVKQLSSRDVPNDLQGANKTREGMKVKELVQMFSVPAAQEKTAVPKEKLRSENPQVKLLAQRHSTIPAQETRVQPMLEDRKEQINKSVSKHPTAGPPVQPERKDFILLDRTSEKAEKSSATDGAIFESKKDSKEEAQSGTDMAPEPTPAAAKWSEKEDLSMIEAAEPDISASRKVKELAQMFAVQETAARPQPKRGQERGPSQLKFRAQRFLQTKPQETIVQLEEEHGGVQPAQKLPDPTSTPTTMKTASSKATKHQDHKPSGEASELAGSSAGPKELQGRLDRPNKEGQKFEPYLFDMSLQICHCGWSKVTTYHGLRTHQGKKGCTPKGMHIPQHKLFSYFPPTLTPPSLIKIEDISSDIYRTPAKSVTTYHDLRTEQGMMGYTPQEKRAPERNQNPWSNKWEQSHLKDNWAVQSTPVKEESVFMSPNLITQMNSVLTQVPAQDMYTSMVHAEGDSQQLVAKLRTSKTLEFKIGFQRDTPEISQSDFFTTQMSSAPTQISLTQSDTSFFQTPPRSQQGSAFSDKASRMLDFSFGDSKASKNAQFMINTDKDALSDKRDKEREAERLLQARHNMMKVQLQQKIHIREQKMAEVRSAVKSCQGSLDAEWVQINTVFSEVIRAVEDAQQKALEPLEKRRQKVEREAQNLLQTLQGEIDRLKNAIDELDRNQDLQASPPPALADSKEVNNLNIDTSFSFGTLRATISTMMKEIQQHLENLSSLELKRIATFAVDVKLDSATAHQCLVLSNDGKKVQDGGEKLKSPDTPERFDLFGSVLGINSLNRGRSYWEVEVKNKTGWDLGVARRSANRKGILKVNPDNGYWVAVHFEGRKYAALTVPPTSLPLKENPQKVGVFVDYEEGVVSFYDVTKGSHIFSFTECLFRDDIFPYFSPHLKINDKNADPLVISAV